MNETVGIDQVGGVGDDVDDAGRVHGHVLVVSSPREEVSCQHNDLSNAPVDLLSVSLNPSHVKSCCCELA